jgi:uncharacterized protein YaiL (DUF2058 family)
LGNSLQEQLLKLGLVDEQKLRKSKQEKHKQKQTKSGPENEHRKQLQKEQAEKAERDRLLNLQRQEAAERKAALAQIKQLIEANRLPKSDGDIAFNFIDGRKVKRLYVNPAVHAQLTQGVAVVVKAKGRYDLVPAETAERIRERDPACVVTADPIEHQEEDDAYAAHPVPDDLMW